MKKRRRHLVQRAVQATGMPEDIVLGMPRILLRGKSQLLLENHQGVIEYSSDRLRIRTMLGVVTVVGDCLMLSELGENDLMISGTVHSLDLGGGCANAKGRMV